MAEASGLFSATLTPCFNSLNKTIPFSHFQSHSHLIIFRKRPIHCSLSTSDTAKSTATQTVPWGCDIDSLENASALQKWLSESGLPPQKMAIQRVEVGERGLVASKNIRKGEKLLFVPPSLVITADSEWSCAEAGKVLKQNSVPDWPLLATYLISEASQMKSSRWRNYISALPRQPYSLLYWTRAELDRYLEASQIRERAIERITDVIGTYDDLRLRIFSNYPHLFPEEVFNIETFKWSFGILFSRLVRLPSMDGRVALVPWADMMNHSCEVDTFLDYDKPSKGVVFTTDRPYEPGEQVYISYGKKSNGELLLSYGFVPKEGTNPSDSVELSLSLEKSDKCYKEKLEALRKYELSTSQCFPIQVTGWPVELMAYAYLAVSPPSMSRQFKEMSAAASKKNTTKKDLRYPEIEEQALQFILDACESSLSKYNKFLQSSGSMDLDVTSPKQLNRRLFLKQLAVDLCTSERRILFRTQYLEAKDGSATVSEAAVSEENALKIKEWEVGMFHNEVAATQGIRIRRRPPTGPPLHYVGPFEFRLQNEGNIPRNILEEIIWNKDKEVSQSKDRRPLSSLKKYLDNAPPTRDFIGALKAANIRTGLPGLIAEVKKASPSRGVLREDFDPVEIGRAYERGGAACLSVLTDEKYFMGSFENLQLIKNAGVKCPLLCKEFVIDAYQIYNARIKGADAILLIAAVLPDLDIKYMIKICKILGLAALVEVHDEREMDRVLGIEGVELIGINNRNLETFEVDISNTKKLLEGERGRRIHEKDIIVVGESGLFTPDDIAFVQEAGVRAVLVGESIVKQSDPGKGITGLFGKDISCS